jgi:hypothetical protein
MKLQYLQHFQSTDNWYCAHRQDFESIFRALFAVNIAFIHRNLEYSPIAKGVGTDKGSAAGS